MVDDELKQRWAQAMLAPQALHVAEAQWERLFDGEPRGSERALAFEHISDCADCAATYRELLRLRAEARSFDPHVPAEAGVRPHRRPPALRWGALGLAASLALATLVGLRLLTPETQAPSPLPSAADPLRSSARAQRLLEPQGRLAHPPGAFRWEGAAGLRAYRVELLSADGRTLWSSPEVEGNSTAWPADLRLAPGRYYWRVLAGPRLGAPASEALLSTLVQIEIAE